MKISRFLVLTCAGVGISVSISLSLKAADTTTTVAIDETKLTELYDLWLQNPQPNAYMERRIVEERTRIRALIDSDLENFTTGNVTTDTNSAVDLSSTIVHQKNIVTTLEESVRERKVDLDLLNEEEQKFYLSGTGTDLDIEDARITHSQSELLAKKAILEERIAALDVVIPVQKDKLQKLSNEQQLEQFALIFTLLSYAGILLIIVLIERSIQQFLLSRIPNRNKRYFLKKILSWIIYSITALWFFSKLLGAYPNILSSIAIVGAGIAVALQDVVKDVVGWLLIIQKRYFAPGDRISVGTYTGDVIDIGILRTAMLEVGTTTGVDVLERTGKTIYFPNAVVLTQQVLNYNTTSDYTKAEIQLMLTYESNWQKAEKILAAVLKEFTSEYTEQARKQHTKRTFLFYVANQPNGSQVYMDIAASGINFTLRFNVPIGFRRDVVTKLNREILIRFGKEKDIHIAYNTVRVIPDAVKK